MPTIITLKADRNEGVHFPNDRATYYPVSSIFWETCCAAGRGLIIDSRIQSLYDEEEINYPSSRVLLKEHEGRHLVGLKPR